MARPTLRPRALLRPALLRTTPLRPRTLLALPIALGLACGPALAPLAVPGAPVAHAATASAAEAPAGSGPRIVLETVTPWLGTDGTLEVSGRVENPGDSPLLAPELALHLSNSRLTSRSDIEDWKSDRSAATLLADSADPPEPEPTDDADTATGAPEDAEAEDSPAPVTVPDLPAEIPAGGSQDFSFTVPAEDVGLGTGDWGGRGLEVILRSDAGPVSAYGYTTWWPEPTVDATRVSYVLPMTLTGHSTDGLLPRDVIERAAAEDGALTALLRSARADPAVALAVDPRLLESVLEALADPDATVEDAPAEEEPDAEDPAGEPTDTPEASGPEDSAAPASPEGTPDDATAGGAVTSPADAEDTAHPTEAPTDDPSTAPGASETPIDPAAVTQPPTDAPDPTPHLRDWYTAFLELAHTRTVIALPWADADVAALENAGLQDLADRARSGRSVVTEVFAEARTDVAWPTAATEADLERAAAQGVRTAILSDLQKPAVTSYTSNALSSLTISLPGTASGSEESESDSASGLMEALVVDSGLTDTLSQPDADPAVVAGEYLAELAAITLERPYDSREVFVTLPRSVPVGEVAPTAAAPAGATAALSAGASAPWVETQDLPSLLDGQPVARAPLTTPEVPAGSEDDAAAFGSLADLYPTALTALGENRVRAHRFASAFTDPEAVRRESDHGLLSCTSAGWVGAPLTSVDTCALTAAEASSGLFAGLRPEKGSSVLLVTGEEISIPVIVQNTTDEDARVAVRIRATTPGLSAQQSPFAVVEAGRSARFEVPVTGVANANVESRIELVTETDEVMPETTELFVRVRADWENIGTAVIGSGLLLVLVLGIIKTVSRGRRTIPKNQLDAAVARAHEIDRD